MAYNKARAEKEWLEWKNDEETKLRKLGVDEDTIQRLHAYDWEAFKADRRYRERNDESEQPIDAPAEERRLNFYPEQVKIVKDMERHITYFYRIKPQNF